VPASLEPQRIENGIGTSIQQRSIFRQGALNHPGQRYLGLAMSAHSRGRASVVSPAGFGQGPGPGQGVPSSAGPPTRCAPRLLRRRSIKQGWPTASPPPAGSTSCEHGYEAGHLRLERHVTARVHRQLPTPRRLPVAARYTCTPYDARRGACIIRWVMTAWSALTRRLRRNLHGQPGGYHALMGPSST